MRMMLHWPAHAGVAEAEDVESDVAGAVPRCLQGPPPSAYCCRCRAIDRVPPHTNRSGGLGASSRVAYESESALIHFVVYLVCFAGCVCVYLNYVVLEAHIFAIFWAVVFSIPLRAVLDALTGRKQKSRTTQQQQRRRSSPSRFSSPGSPAVAELRGGAVDLPLQDELRRAATADSAAFSSRNASPSKHSKTAGVRLSTNETDAVSGVVTSACPSAIQSVKPGAVLPPASATEGEKRVIRLKWSRKKCDGDVVHTDRKNPLNEEVSARTAGEKAASPAPLVGGQQTFQSPSVLATTGGALSEDRSQHSLVRSNTAQSLRFRRSKKRKQQPEGFESAECPNTPRSKGDTAGARLHGGELSQMPNFQCEMQRMPWYYRLPVAFWEKIIELCFRFCNSLGAQLFWRLLRLLLLPLAELAGAVPDRRASKPWFGLLHRCCLFLILRRLGIPALELQEVVAILVGVSAVLLLVQLLMLPLRGSRLLRSAKRWQKRIWVFRPWAFMSDSAVEAYVTPVLAVFVIIVFFLVGCVITAFFCFNIYNEMTTLWDLTQAVVDRHVLQSPLVLKTFKRISTLLWQQHVSSASAARTAGDAEAPLETSGAAQTIAGLVAAAASAVRGGTVAAEGNGAVGASAASSVPMLLLGASLSKYSDLWKAIQELASAGGTSAHPTIGAAAGTLDLKEPGVAQVLSEWPLTSSNTRLQRALEENAKGVLTSADGSASQREASVPALMHMPQLDFSRRNAATQHTPIDRVPSSRAFSRVPAEGDSEKLPKPFHARLKSSDTCMRHHQPAEASTPGVSGTRLEGAADDGENSGEGGSWVFGLLSSIGWATPSVAAPSTQNSSYRYNTQMGSLPAMHHAETQTCVNPNRDGGWMAFEAAALTATTQKSSRSSKSIFLRILSRVFVGEGESERRWAKTQELIGQLTEGDMRGVFARATEAWRELYSITREAWALKAYEYAQTILAWIFNSGVGAWRVCCFLLALVVRVFLSAFDLLFQGVVFVGALYALLCSRKGTLDFLEEVLCVADPSKILSTSVNEKIRAILFSSVKRLWFYSLFTWLTYEASGLPVVYVPTAASALLAVLPLLPPETISVIPAVVLWWTPNAAGEPLVKVAATPSSFFDDPLVNLVSLTSNPKFASLLIFAANALVWWNVTTCIYREIPDANPWFVGLSAALGMTTLGLKGIIIGPILATIPLIVFTAASKFNERRGVNVDVSATDVQTVRTASVEHLAGFQGSPLACLALAEAEAMKQLKLQEQKLQLHSKRLNELSVQSPRSRRGVEGSWLPQTSAVSSVGKSAWTLRRSSSTSQVRGSLSDGGRETSSVPVGGEGFSHGLQRRSHRPHCQPFCGQSCHGLPCRNFRSQLLSPVEPQCFPFIDMETGLNKKQGSVSPPLFNSTPTGVRESTQFDVAGARQISAHRRAPRCVDSRHYPDPSLGLGWSSDVRRPLGAFGETPGGAGPGLATQVLRGAADALLWFVEKKNGPPPNGALASTAAPTGALTSTQRLEGQHFSPGPSDAQDKRQSQLWISSFSSGNSRLVQSKTSNDPRLANTEGGKEESVPSCEGSERQECVVADAGGGGLSAGPGRSDASLSDEQESTISGRVHAESGSRVKTGHLKAGPNRGNDTALRGARNAP